MSAKSSKTSLYWKRNQAKKIRQICVSVLWRMLPGKLNFTSNEDTGADKCKDKILPVKKNFTQ